MLFTNTWISTSFQFSYLCHCCSNIVASFQKVLRIILGLSLDSFLLFETNYCLKSKIHTCNKFTRFIKIHCNFLHTLYMSPSFTDVPLFALTDFLLFFVPSDSFSLPILCRKFFLFLKLIKFTPAHTPVFRQMWKRKRKERDET